MGQLLEELARGQRRARVWPRLGAAGLVATGLFAATYLVAAARQRGAQLCRGGGERLAPVYGPAIATRIEAAFQRTGSPLAGVSWREAPASLDGYAAGWLRARRAECERTRVHGEQSEALLDKKMACLDDRLSMLGAVVEILERADAPLLERVPALLHSLPAIASCEQLTERSTSVPLPPAESLAVVDGVRLVLARASAAVSAGRYREALAAAQEAERVTASLRYLPVQAEAALWLGVAHGRLGQLGEAEQALSRAAASASAARAEVIAVQAWIHLMHFIGSDARRYEDGARFNDYAEAALRGMSGTEELDAERLSWLSAIRVGQRRFDDALEASQRQHAIIEARFGPRHRVYAMALDGIAGVLLARGQAARAIAPQKEACDVLEATLGAPHPQLALCLNNLASLHAGLGAHEQALALKRRALAMFEALPGHPGHQAMAQRNLARSLIELGRLPEAEEALTAAASLGTQRGDEVALHRLRADLLRRQGQPARAVAEEKRAVELSEGLDATRRLDALLALIEAQLAAHDPRSADAVSDRALALAEHSLDESSYRLAEPLRLRAEVLLALHRPVDARPLAERAVARLASAEVDPSMRQRAEASLARALAR